MKPLHTNNFQREYDGIDTYAGGNRIPEATTPLQEGGAATPVSAEAAIKCFLSKWQCWFMLESNGKELMEAFKKELYQIVDYTATPAPEVTPAAPVARKEENKTK